MTRCTLCHSARPLSPCPCEPGDPHDPYACLTNAELETALSGAAEVRSLYAAVVGLMPDSELPRVPEGLREPARELARRRAGTALPGGGR